MKTRDYRLKGMFIVAAIVFTITSCNKKDDVVKEEVSAETVDLVTENAMTELIEEEIDASINVAISYFDQLTLGLKSAAVEEECAVITISPSDNTFPKTITIDFGEGCESITGIIRSGSMTITLSDTIRNMEAEYSVVFENYTVNDYAVSGTKSVVNSGTETSMSFTEETHLEITTPDEVVITKDKYITRDWIEGSDTFMMLDDVFLISGYADVSTSAGDSYSYTIIEPLKVSRICPNILEGIIELTYSGTDNTITIDYGDGECDWDFDIS